ncbi:ent-kaurenoic acid monooxygenase [Salvia divinorum]|uniref:Ent-kaurenoic acid monooxygenase n=1 Tax=Salvia divinorum TaxID=28513 RepID=A0ABD1GBT0_SALDI
MSRYGDGVGMYRTHLFGSPMIIACTPSANKFVLQSDSRFVLNLAPRLPSNRGHKEVESQPIRKQRRLYLQTLPSSILQASRRTASWTPSTIYSWVFLVDLELILSIFQELLFTMHSSVVGKQRPYLDKSWKQGRRYVSTSLVVMWALYYLAKHPQILQKLRDEHMPISKKLKGDFITYEEIASCKYTAKVVEEVIRMANIAAFIFRTAKKDVRLQRIPKGWTVVCWLRYLHTNPEHFEDPMCFNPDRWNEAPKTGSYLVFGGGTRICAGNMFARLQLTIIIHHLAVGYRWKLVNPNVGMSYLPHPKPADEVELDISQI